MNAYHQSLPKKRMSSGCLLFDHKDRVLLVNPTYKEPWEIPGGIVEQNESPLQACVREVQEELGLTVQPKHLLCIDYTPTSDDRSESLSFIFHGGTLSAKQIANIKLQEKELSEYRFCTQAERSIRLNERVGKRVEQCLSTIKMNQTLYLESQKHILYISGYNVSQYFTDYKQHQIRLSDERQQHITMAHPEMSKQIIRIQETLNTPDQVVRSKTDDQVTLYYKLYPTTPVTTKHLCVVVKSLVDDIFVITAYFTDSVKKGDLLWTKK